MLNQISDLMDELLDKTGEDNEEYIELSSDFNNLYAEARRLKDRVEAQISQHQA
tara:strand:+ start:17570 stop:17731 length:162 start_codon:yes stop_codon:yes gene_type:complete